MKKAAIIAAVLALALALGGCGLFGGPEAGPSEGPTGAPTGEPGESAPTGKLEAIPFEEGQLYAAAYLGYQEIEDLDYYIGRYLDSAQLPIHYVSDGDYYLIIPRYTGMTVTLSVNDLETSRPTAIFIDPDCGPFIVQCNASDVFADVTIRLEHRGDAAEFSPFISLESGAPMMGERGLDLTKAGTAGPVEPV